MAEETAKGEEEMVEVDLVDFSKPITEQLVEFDCANYLTSNFTERGYAKGLKTYTCACGAHSFAAAFDDKMEAWVRHQRMNPRVRQLIEEKVGAPERPSPAPVVLIDVDDAQFLRERRWKVFPAPRGHRVKWHLKGGTRGHAIQRLIFPKAECVAFHSTDSFDLRRCNLRCTSLKVLLRERKWRRTRPYSNHPSSARVRAWRARKAAEKKAAA